MKERKKKKVEGKTSHTDTRHRFTQPHDTVLIHKCGTKFVQPLNVRRMKSSKDSSGAMHRPLNVEVAEESGRKEAGRDPLLCNSRAHTGSASTSTRRSKSKARHLSPAPSRNMPFSKVSAIVDLYSMFNGKLTFESFYPQHRVQRRKYLTRVKVEQNEHTGVDFVES